MHFELKAVVKLESKHEHLALSPEKLEDALNWKLQNVLEDYLHIDAVKIDVLMIQINLR